MNDPATLERDALYAARDSARGRRDVNAPGAVEELAELEREIARLRDDYRTVAADVLARDAVAPVDEHDGERYAADARLEPGCRVDLETGEVVYSAAWL
jgi:hypothetical protein